MTKEYLDLKIDFMFKQLFGHPTRKHITIAFLNDLLGRVGSDRIVDLNFENTEYVKDQHEGKTVRLDLTVFTNASERINIEIQLINQHDMPERILYYWAKTFSSSIHTGESYLNLPQTIIIILNFPLFPSETDRFHTIFHIKEDEDHFLWSHLLQFHVFDLSTFMVQWRKYRRKLKEQNLTELPWLMMLSAADYRKKRTDPELLTELEEWAMNQEQVREALIEWETLSANKENRVIYEARMKELRDQLSNLQGERRLGREEGREKGLKEGKKEGLRDVAKKMLERGMGISDIADITGLSVDEINNIKKK
ncbi:Rpn family recombination-promoting nuclease/putative transposase [Bacillus sp. JJ1532]|uniref:Rpn family recombination-promoting nuclease/putative transposase n=1 Tax=Bacillus sp. JJ1532 TaxID=3122958 RepID=UPI00300044E1